MKRPTALSASSAAAATRSSTAASASASSWPRAASLDRWVPSVAGKGVVIGGPNNDGSAMLTAVSDVGVPLSHMQYIASYTCGIVTGGRNGPYCRWWFITNQGGILVNKNGKRFVTEK